MRRLFQKGEPRPATAGRRAGTLNKSTQEVGQFCREVIESPAFQRQWREYFTTRPLHRMEPKLLALAFAYAYGKPRERVELTGAENAPLEPQMIFYLPSKDPHANPP
jgi:hypothetical protein